MTFEKWFEEELRKYTEDRDMRAALERSKGSVEIGWQACEAVKNAEIAQMNDLCNQAMRKQAEEIVTLRSQLLRFENQKPVEWSEITKMCNWFSSDRPKLYTTQVAKGEGMTVVPNTLNPAMYNVLETMLTHCHSIQESYDDLLEASKGE